MGRNHPHFLEIVTTILVLSALKEKSTACSEKDGSDV